MIQPFKNYSRVLLLCCMGCFCMASMASGQTTYKIERTLDVAKAFALNSPTLGIKANAAGGKVEVRMYAKNNYTTGGRADKDAMLYGAFSNSNSPSSYVATSWTNTWIDAPNNLCGIFIFGNFLCAVSGGPGFTITRESTSYKDPINQVARKTAIIGDGVIIDYYNNPTIPVIIELEVHSTTTLDNVYDIKLPGVAGIAGLEFDLAVKAYTNPCPGAVGCDAVADFKNVADAANKKPIVIAHRGYHGMRGGVPENSLAAVQKAYDEKFRYVEVDMRMTIDYVPIIFHDDFYGFQTTLTPLNNTNPNTETEKLTWSQISGLKYRDRYWDGTYRTATNNDSTTVQARIGNATNVGMSSFAAVCDYIKGKDIMVYLDIKSTPTARNFEVMKQSILIAAQKNVLHQIAVKVVRTNLPDDNPKKLYMTLAEAKKYMGNVYTAFKNHLNVHVVDYAPDLPASFINDWIAEGNVVGFEFDPVHTPMFEAASLKPFSGYNNKSAWQYTKDLGYRTGIWSSTALDPRGRPGHDPSHWGTGAVMIIDVNSWQHYRDHRARLETLSLLAPQYLTHDRPDEVYNYLNAVSKLNSNTKR